MPLSGRGDRKILIVGMCPGKQEDRENRPFVGPSGKLIEEAFRRVDIDMRRDCWITNACICHPKNDDLPPKSVDYCRPNLINTIKQLEPKAIFLFGTEAVKSLIGWLWKEDTGTISQWVGNNIPCQRLNAWIHPIWHPSYLLHAQGQKKQETVLLHLLFNKFIKQGSRRLERPYDVVPDYRNQLDLIYSPTQAAQAIRGFLKRKKPISFDYETDRLKPDSSSSEIICCAVSDGEKTIAFPWLGEAIDAMAELLFSNIPKLGWNMSFEQRWTVRHLGKPVNNWAWDGMVNAHLIDNREGTTGLKFQAFVQLGQESYDDDIKPFLQNNDKSGNRKNRIKEVPLPKLLTYCGMDALLEHLLCEMQMEKLGLEISR